jgi:hypothetical protein
VRRRVACASSRHETPGKTDAFPSYRSTAHGPRITETLRASFGGGRHREKSSAPKKKKTLKLSLWLTETSVDILPPPRFESPFYGA